jgi:hypothetical protein
LSGMARDCIRMTRSSVMDPADVTRRTIHASARIRRSISAMLRPLLAKDENDILALLAPLAKGTPWSSSSTRISGCCGRWSARR